MLFSQRKGFKSIKKIIQIDSMDDELRNGLWNGVFLIYFRALPNSGYGPIDSDIGNLIRFLWIDHFKRPIDDLSSHNPSKLTSIKNYFFKCEWWEVYDFIEFIIKKCPNEDFNSRFISYINIVLEDEFSAYRVVGKELTEITSEEEIEEIETALNEAPNPVSIHLNKSLELLSDRKSPDYRNSIKESISAIESICKLITKKPKGTLGRCLNVIENDVDVHPDLKEAFKKLYGYTSDAEGIRHALMEDESKLDFEDAKFMLVSCSAFTNYLMAKAAKSGIEL